MVIGRNQNPWRETNVFALRQHDIPLIRRKSGGGTVYHDLGNVNYSVMMPSTVFDRDEHALMICSAINPILAAKGNNVRVNERHDIVDKFGRKVSGSAYKLQRQKSYHHGTMLLSSKLENLRGMLRRDKAEMGEIDSSGVESVHSSVANLSIGISEFIKAVTHKFQTLYGQPENTVVRHIDESSTTLEERHQIEPRIAELKVIFYCLDYKQFY